MKHEYHEGPKAGENFKKLATAVSAPLFGGLGAAIGALVPSRGRWQEVYQAK
jgi:hypothetical protein